MHAQDSFVRALRILAGVAALPLVLAGAIVAYLAWPGTPGTSAVMHFDGYIELPERRSLNVLDYLTLNNQTLFVTSESSGSVFRITLDPSHPASSTVAEMPGAGAAHGVMLLPGEDVAFVTRSEANTVDVFSPSSLRQIQSIPVADDADGIFYIPSVKFLYVANGDARLATLIDPATRSPVGVIHLPGKPEFAALDPLTGLLFQNLEDIDAVAAIDMEKRSIAGQWSLGPCKGPSGMAMDADRRRLFAVCSGNAKLVVFNLDTHHIVASVNIGGGPDSVAFDAGMRRIYAAGKSGQLTVIQQNAPDSYRVLDEIRTHYGAHTLAVDPVSHRVYVGYASLLVHPRIAVFSPKG